MQSKKNESFFTPIFMRFKTHDSKNYLIGIVKFPLKFRKNSEIKSLTTLELINGHYYIAVVFWSGTFIHKVSPFYWLLRAISYLQQL